MASEPGSTPSAAPIGRLRKSPSKRFGGKNAIRLVEGVYVVLLGVLFSALLWTILTPLPAPTNLPAKQSATKSSTDVSVISEFDPFFGSIPEVVQDVKPVAQETRLSLKLVGVVYANGDIPKTATIEKDGGDQRPYFVGDTVISGAVIEDILPDRVILLRNGVRESLSLEGRDGLSTGQTNRGASTAPNRLRRSSALIEDDLARLITIRPTGNGNLSLYAGDDPQLFSKLGLQSGDRLMAINGTPVSSLAGEDFSGIAQRFMAGRSTITVERNGRSLNLTVDPTGLVQ